MTLFASYTDEQLHHFKECLIWVLGLLEIEIQRRNMEIEIQQRTLNQP